VNYYNYFRDYDASIGRYTKSDPIGLRGGTNTYGYVEGNPLYGIDPLGLVNWSGSFGGIAGVDGAGAGFFRFDLTSECKCGRQVRIKGYMSTVAVGIGAKYTGSGGSASFYDYAECPDAGIANGFADMVSASNIMAFGGSCSKIQMGRLRSSPPRCSGPSYGFDVSAGMYFGSSVVTSVETKSCDSCSKQN
jgi:hypothetical protein